MCGKKTRGPWWEEPAWERATSPQLVCGLPEGRVWSIPSTFPASHLPWHMAGARGRGGGGLPCETGAPKKCCKG